MRWQRRNYPKGATPDVADDLYRDLRAAEVLLRNTDARDGLWKLHGIDGSAYLARVDDLH